MLSRTLFSTQVPLPPSMMTTLFSSVGLKINGNYIFDESYIKLVHENSIINSKSAQSQNDYSSASEESAYVGNIRRDESGSYSFALYPLDNDPSGHFLTRADIALVVKRRQELPNQSAPLRCPGRSR